MGNEDGKMPTRKDRGLKAAENEVDELFPSVCVEASEVFLKINLT